MRKHTPRFTRDPNYPKISIGLAQHRVLETIGRFGHLDAVQVTSLHYSAGSERDVKRMLQALYHNEYLWRSPLIINPGSGSARPIYSLDNLGYRVLQSAGCAPEGRFNALELKVRHPYNLIHTLQANSCIILAKLLAKEDPSFQLVRFMTEYELKRAPLYVTVEGTQVGAIPDGWIELRHKRGSYIAFELDRATEGREAFQSKIEALVYYYHGPYKEYFRTEYLSIAFVVAEGGSRRVNQIRSWTEDKLSQMEGGKSQWELFFFSGFEPETADPPDVFLSPIWWQPFANAPTSLLEG